MDMGMMIRGGVAPSLYQIQTSSGEKMPTREGKRKPKLKKKMPKIDTLDALDDEMTSMLNTL